MKKLIVLLLCLCVGVGAIAQGDFKVEVNQTAFNKVINSVKFPFTMFERRDPFKSASLQPGTTVNPDDELVTRTLSKQQAITYFQWAVENARTIGASTADAVDSEYKEALQIEWENMKREIQEILDQHQSNRTQSGYSFPYQDYTPEELQKIQKASVEDAINFFNAKEAGAFGIRVHLAYLRVNLNQQPSLTVASPVFTVNNIKVEPTATGELWVKLPVFRCCPPKISWKWKRIASVTVSPDFAAGAKVTFSQSYPKVIATAAFTRLVLDYPILRELDLKSIANRSLSGKHFELYDVSAFVASLPYIDSHFRIESLTLPQNPDGVTIQVSIAQMAPGIAAVDK